MKIELWGKIEELSLPDGWEEQQQPARVVTDTRQLRKFVLNGDSDVQLCMYYRGRPMTYQTGQNFRKVLDAASHQLLPREIASVGEVLAEMKDTEVFKATTIQTQDFAGEKVMVAEGNWTKLGFDCYSLFADVHGDGLVVHQIYFAAPQAVYLRYIKQARQILQSIKWRQPNMTTAQALGYST